MNPTLGFRARAWAFKPRGTSVDSGRRDLLHFHLDREVMYVVHKFTNVKNKNYSKKWSQLNIQIFTKSNPHSQDCEKNYSKKFVQNHNP